MHVRARIRCGRAPQRGPQSCNHGAAGCRTGGTGFVTAKSCAFTMGSHGPRGVTAGTRVMEPSWFDIKPAHAARMAWAPSSHVPARKLPRPPRRSDPAQLSPCASAALLRRPMPQSAQSPSSIIDEILNLHRSSSAGSEHAAPPRRRDAPSSLQPTGRPRRATVSTASTPSQRHAGGQPHPPPHHQSSISSSLYNQSPPPPPSTVTML